MSPLWIVLYATVWAFAAIYPPQPILPVLATEFAVSPAEASLLITATLLPLGFASVLYGFLLEAVAARALLRVSVGLLALAQLPFLWLESFWLLVAVRALQGLLLPAVLTGLMTYLSTTVAQERLRRAMGLYVAATIAGGFFGRFMAGAVTELLHWRVAFAVIFAGLAGTLLLLERLPKDAETNFARLDKKAVVEVLRQPLFVTGYLMIFCVFFVFASLFNILPFRLVTLQPDLSSAAIGGVYVGYLIGIASALGSSWMTQRLGGEVQAMGFGLGLYLLGTLLFAVDNVAVSYGAMILFSGGMFCVNALLSGFLNLRAQAHKGVVNGLYVAFYYLGGSIGSSLPGPLFQDSGWDVYIIFLALMLAFTLGLNWRLGWWVKR